MFSARGSFTDMSDVGANKREARKVSLNRSKSGLASSSFSAESDEGKPGQASTQLTVHSRMQVEIVEYINSKQLNLMAAEMFDNVISRRPSSALSSILNYIAEACSTKELIEWEGFICVPKSAQSWVKEMAKDIGDAPMLHPLVADKYRSSKSPDGEVIAEDMLGAHKYSLQRAMSRNTQCRTAELASLFSKAAKRHTSAIDQEVGDSSSRKGTFENSAANKIS